MHPPVTSGIAAETVFVVGSGIPLRIGVGDRFDERRGREIVDGPRGSILVSERGATRWIRRGRSLIVRRREPAKNDQQDAEPARAHVETP